MLSVDQVFVMYDANNELVRFAMSNKIGDINGEVTEIIFVFLFRSANASFLEYNILTEDSFTKSYGYCEHCPKLHS